ncbi:hypothetical protein [Sphingomonas psychrotolerans]|uniref:hypothetical protein n=1 Tax=Sphingomonas psychrotolerans TaxID=1327635 RepID=UPI001305159C|nr:hypothetical protein [Sphingomonas psychrotolerans]
MKISVEKTGDEGPGAARGMRIGQVAGLGESARRHCHSPGLAAFVPGRDPVWSPDAGAKKRGGALFETRPALCSSGAPALAGGSLT